MKTVTALLLYLLAFSTFANNGPISNHECIGVYREGYTNLKEFVEQYNNERIDRLEFSALVAGNSADIMVHRSACYVFENDTVNDCVSKYKQLYKGLRSQIQLRSVIVGNQDTVSYSEQMQEVVEIEQIERTETQNWYQKLKGIFKGGSAISHEAIERTKQVAKLAIYDEKCGY